ncbi:MAG: PIN domain-containing protein [Aliidongia sp.]
MEVGIAKRLGCSLLPACLIVDLAEQQKGCSMAEAYANYKPPIVLYDACVLYPFHLRNLLVQCAVDRLVDARWSDDIHDEWSRNLVANNPSNTIERLSVTRRLMNDVLPNATVTDYAQYISKINLPDADDRHVVAAAIVGNASLIVTWNGQDFPARELERYKLRQQTPDDLLMNLYAVKPAEVVAMASNARRNLRQSMPPAVDFLKALERQRLRKFSMTMNGHLSDL